MNLLHYLKNAMLPGLKPQMDNAPEETGNCVVFSLNPASSDEPHIKIRIEDTSLDACQKFAEMLFEINAGSYYESTLNLMMRMSEQDLEIKKFIELAILYWGLLLKDKNKNISDDKNKPVIMPTDFNKNAR